MRCSITGEQSALSPNTRLSPGQKHRSHLVAAPLKAMLDRLTSGYVQEPVTPGPTPAAPSGLTVNDVSDDGVAIAWTPIAGIKAYNVYRGTGRDNAFTRLGSVSAPSFADMGLHPGATYSYKVAAIADDGGEGPSSTVVTASTLSTPPRCDKPGSCAVR